MISNMHLHLNNSKDLRQRVLCWGNRWEEAEEVMGWSVRQHLKVIWGILGTKKAASQH